MLPRCLLLTAVAALQLVVMARSAATTEAMDMCCIEEGPCLTSNEDVGARSMIQRSVVTTDLDMVSIPAAASLTGVHSSRSSKAVVHQESSSAAKDDPKPKFVPKLPGYVFPTSPPSSSSASYQGIPDEGTDADAEEKEEKDEAKEEETRPVVKAEAAEKHSEEPVEEHVEERAKEHAREEVHGTEESHSSEQGHEKRHKSIFTLQFTSVNRLPFWIIFTLMLLFTIFMDRLQFFAADRVSHSETEKMFLDRINAELMMFGCVGLFMFVFENLASHLPAEQAILIEFVDILCSMGACNLIAEAFMLFVTRNIIVNHWFNLEIASVHSHVRPTAPGIFPYFNAPQFQWMATRFRQAHQLPSTFEYYQYLNECLARSACDFMNIDWKMWFFLMCVTGGIAVLEMLEVNGRNMLYFETDLAYVEIFMILNWSNCFAFFVLLAIVVRGVSLLQHHLTLGSVGDPRIDCLENEAAWAPWAWKMQTAMQAVGLMNSFLISFYIMLVHINLRRGDYSWYFAALLLAPLLISLMILLPLVSIFFTLVRAYFDPISCSIDVVLESATRLQDNLRYLKRQLQSMGSMQKVEKWLANHPTGEASEEELQLVLRNLGLHISKERTHRICMDITSNVDRGVPTDELLDLLKRDGS